MDNRVQIELLGELKVIAPDGTPIALSASPKTKALLAYLVLTDRRQFREHLCDLLWDGTEDPRGALRWSLSRLRASLDTASCKRIESDRRSIGLVKDTYEVDWHRAEAAIAAAGEPPALDALRSVAAQFRGELLEGLDLLDSFRFHTWCAGQRETVRAFRIRVLTALIERVSDPDEALGHAHALVSIDPLNERAHSNVIQLLVDMRRHADAQKQVTAYRRILEIELGSVPGDVAARLRKLVHAEPVPRTTEPPQPSSPAAVSALPMCGRVAELAVLSSWLRERRRRAPLALITGPPGVGKTRLMNEVIAGASGDALVIRGRAYQVESGRPLGPWRDALAAVVGVESVLSSSSTIPTDQRQRMQLFDELSTLITTEAARVELMVIALDDIQWLDETSAALLHLLARSASPNVALLATARPAELIDNPSMGDALQSLRRESAIKELALSALGRAEIQQLCAAIADHVDAEQVFTRSEGNPVLATEIARALACGQTELPRNTLRLGRDSLAHLVRAGARVTAVGRRSRPHLSH